MLPTEVFKQYVDRMAELEKEDPVVCTWRTQAGHTFKERLPLLRMIVRRSKQAVWRSIPCPQPRPGQVVFLIAADTPATMGTVRPVIREMNRRGKPPFLIMSKGFRKALGDGYHNEYVDIRHLLSHLPAKDRRSLFKRAGDLAERVHRSLGPYPDGNALAWLFQAMAARAMAVRILRDAAVVVADCEIEPWRKGLFLGAASIGKPTVVLQHGLFGPYHFPMHASHLFTWGPYFCEDAGSYGLGEVKCEPLGCPRFDHLPALRKRGKDPSLCRRLGVDTTRPVILLISNAHGAKAHPAHYGAFFKGVQKLLEAGLQVVIKLHPAEKDLEAYERVIPGPLLRRLIVLPKETAIESALLCSDVVYHVFSAAALEAMALGVPTLFAEGTAGKKLCDYPDREGGEWVTTQDVAGRCQVIVSNEGERERVVQKQDQFMRTALASLGSASQSIADRLEEFIARGPR